MKYRLTALSIALFLIACGGEDSTTNENGSEQQEEQNEDEDNGSELTMDYDEYEESCLPYYDTCEDDVEDSEFQCENSWNFHQDYSDACVRAIMESWDCQATEECDDDGDACHDKLEAAASEC